MISLIVHHHPDVRDAFVRALSLERKHSENGKTLYQHGKWLYIALENPIDAEVYVSLLEEYNPDTIYAPIFWQSIDMIHEEGDIILPNVFLSYNPLLETTEVDESNRDTFLGQADFLESYNEQKDYYVEDFGLSIGGIVVGWIPENYNTDMNDWLMMAYEADVYVTDSLVELISAVKTEAAPTYITCGVIRGKKSAHPTDSILDVTVRNMITTWRLMEDEE